jgi:hypothetical protein
MAKASPGEFSPSAFDCHKLTSISSHDYVISSANEEKKILTSQHFTIFNAHIANPKMLPEETRDFINWTI